jgi:hypothetical protein
MSEMQPPLRPEEPADTLANLTQCHGRASGDDRLELSVSPFVTFYFTYQPEQYLDTALAMIGIHEAFEVLTGNPYSIVAPPGDQRPQAYDAARPGNLHEWAYKAMPNRDFAFRLTDTQDHRSSPTTAGYFWLDGHCGQEELTYSSIQLYYRWQWWLDNKAAWRRFVLETIGRLRPQQVYSGFAVANPLQDSCRAEVAVRDRALAPRYYGLDTDYPFGMTLPPNLPSGIRPPTWAFFLSDDWRVRLALDREQVCAALHHPDISIVDCATGQWIELGAQPQLYPIENGVPELPALLNRLLKPIRHPSLELTGFSEWDGDPSLRFDHTSTRRWLSRFDDDSV